jgi:hypothetical protein
LQSLASLQQIEQLQETVSFLEVSYCCCNSASVRQCACDLEIAVGL